jgi:hypothetical protein
MSNLSLIVNGTLTIGSQLVSYSITPTGDLVFHGGSRAKAMAIAEALDNVLQHGANLHAAPPAIVNAATSTPEVAPPGRRLAKDGTLRGRPSKADATARLKAGKDEAPARARKKEA